MKNVKIDDELIANVIIIAGRSVFTCEKAGPLQSGFIERAARRRSSSIPPKPKVAFAFAFPFAFAFATPTRHYIFYIYNITYCL